MEWLHAIVCIVGGGLAASTRLLTGRPDAATRLGRLAPLHALLGGLLLALGVTRLLQAGPLGLLRALKFLPVPGLLGLVAVFGAILLGSLLLLPMIAHRLPGASPTAPDAAERARLVAPHQARVGLLVGVTGLLLLLRAAGLVALT